MRLNTLKAPKIKLFPLSLQNLLTTDGLGLFVLVFLVSRLIKIF